MTNAVVVAGAQAGSSPRPAKPRRRSNRKRVSTMKRRRVAAARMHRVVLASFVFDDVPTPVVPPPERLFVRRDVLDPGEVQAMLATCSTSSRIGLRDRALIAAGYWGCARQLELLDVELGDVDAAAGTLTIRWRNGTRVVQLPQEAAAMLDAWAERRRRLHKPRAHVGLFCTLKDGLRPAPVTRHDLQGILDRAARSAKVTKPVSFDALRNARAKELALAGIELRPLAELLDHWHLKTGTRELGPGVRADLERTRALVTELAPWAPCAGFYDRSRKSPITEPGYHLGREPGNKGRQFPAEVLTSDEIRAMLRLLPKRGVTALRNRAIIVVLWRCGLRVAEALALEPKDVDLKLGTVTVLQGKGNKRRIVGIDPRACEDIARWLETRGALGLKPYEGKLFVAIQMPYRGRPMKPQTVRMMLKTLARRAGIHKRVHPHGLRHTHAFELMKEGTPLPIIQKQLGHNDLATTAHYIDHLAPFEVINAMQKREWAFAR